MEKCPYCGTPESEAEIKVYIGDIWYCTNRCHDKLAEKNRPQLPLRVTITAGGPDKWF